MSGSPDTDARPTELATKAGDKAQLLTFKREKQAKDKRNEDKPAGGFEDLAQFDYSRGGVLATGIAGTGGFTVVDMGATAGRFKVAVSFAMKDQPTPPEFRVVAVDVNGKRIQGVPGGAVSAGGNGITVVTAVSEFDLGGAKIESLVIQKRPKVKK